METSKTKASTRLTPSSSVSKRSGDDNPFTVGKRKRHVFSQNKLHSRVSQWERSDIEGRLKIYYAKKSIGLPLDVLTRLPNCRHTFTQDEKQYIDKLKSCLKFNTDMQRCSYRILSTTCLKTLDEVIQNLSEKEDIRFHFEVARPIWKFIKEIKRIILKKIDALEEKKRWCDDNLIDDPNRSHINEGMFTELIRYFAEMCCLTAVPSSDSDHVRWRNLRETQEVISKPDFRLYRFGWKPDDGNHDEEMMVSVIQIKADEDVSRRSKKRKRVRSSYETSSSSEYSSSSEASSSVSETTSTEITSGTILTDSELMVKDIYIKPDIEIYLDKRTIGQHAGELLLNLHDYYERRLRNEQVPVPTTLTMPGMIVDGTKVYFTLLEISYQHYQKLKGTDNLDDIDRAVIYYSDPLDMLCEHERNILIESFMMLNNIESILR